MTIIWLKEYRDNMCDCYNRYTFNIKIIWSQVIFINNNEKDIRSNIIETFILNYFVNHWGIAGVTHSTG